MNERTKLIMSVIASTLASLVSVWFVGEYVVGFDQMFEQQGLGLPEKTVFVLAVRNYAFLFPIVLLASGLSGALKSGKGLYVAHASSLIGWLFAITWPLFCVIAMNYPMQVVMQDLG